MGREEDTENFEIYFQNKLMITLPTISAPPRSSLFSSAEFKNKDNEENT